MTSPLPSIRFFDDPPYSGVRFPRSPFPRPSAFHDALGDKSQSYGSPITPAGTRQDVSAPLIDLVHECAPLSLCDVPFARSRTCFRTENLGQILSGRGAKR